MAQILPFKPVAEPNLSDGALVERALEHVEWARRELFLRHGKPVLSLLTRLLHSTADAEDAAQDVFAEAFRDLLTLRNRNDFGRWVRCIAMHQAHRRFRRRKWLSLIGAGPELDAPFEALVDESVSPERRAELAMLSKHIATLPTVERLAWSLRHVEGLELNEIAEALKLSLATVKRKIHAAEVALTKHIGGP